MGSKDKSNYKTITVNMTSRERFLLEKMAKERNLSLNEFLCDALDQYLKAELKKEINEEESKR